MTIPAEVIEGLRELVRSSPSGDAARGTVDTDTFPNAEIVTERDGAISSIAVTPASPTTVADLEAILGPARRLPRNPADGSLTVLFGDTVPDEGESGASVLAEVDADGRVSRLIVRAEAF